MMGELKVKVWRRDEGKLCLLDGESVDHVWLDEVSDVC